MIVGTVHFAETDGREYDYIEAFGIIKKELLKYPDVKIIEQVDFVRARECDVVFFSLFWYAHYYSFVNYIISSGIKIADKNPLIIIGGIQVINPLPISEYFHYACIGDGDEWIKEVIPLIAKKDYDGIAGIQGTYYRGIPGLVELRSDGGPSGVPFYTGRLWRFEVARGCKMHCRFCAVSWIKKYREIDRDECIGVLNKLRNNTCSVYAPSRSHISYAQELREVIKKNNINDLACDCHISSIGEYPQANLDVGIEGLSIKLRRRAGKNYSDEYIIEQIKKYEEHGGKLLRLYFILDMPGESDEDYDSFRVLLNKMDAANIGITIKIRGNMFIANPLTPFQFGKMDINNNVRDKLKKAIYPNAVKDPRNFKIVMEQSLYNRWSRIKQIIATCGGETVGAALREILINKKLQRPGDGTINGFNGYYKLDSLMAEKGSDYKFPWDFIKYSKNHLERIYRL